MLNAPEGGEVPGFLFVNICDHPDGGLHHFHAVLAKEFPLVLNELLPEAHVGPDDGPARFDPVMSL